MADSEHYTALALSSKLLMTALQMHKVICYTLFISLLCISSSSSVSSLERHLLYDVPLLGLEEEGLDV